MGSESDNDRSKTSSTDLKRELRKNEKELLDARLDPIEAIAKEAKVIALSAKKESGAYKNVKFAAVITFIVFAVSAIGAYYTLREKVGTNEKAVVEYKADMTTVKADMASVKIDIQEVKAIVEESKKQSVKKDVEQLEQIGLVIKEEFAKQNKKPRRR